MPHQYSLFWGILALYIQKAIVILSWIEFIPSADTQIDKGEDKSWKLHHSSS